MVPLSMTLNDFRPGLQGHNICEVEYRKNGTSITDKVTISHQ